MYFITSYLEENNFLKNTHVFFLQYQNNDLDLFFICIQGILFVKIIIKFKHRNIYNLK